jgi:hypothetical protein
VQQPVSAGTRTQALMVAVGGVLAMSDLIPSMGSNLAL